MIRQITLIALAFTIFSCTKKEDKSTVWIYTSLYKDTVADVQPQLEKAFPDIKVQFYQAGSEEVAAKVQAENLSGKIQADVLISSDRFWYEDMAEQKKLMAYQPKNSEKVDALFKHPESFYNTVSFPVMVIAYNSDAVTETEAPKTFKELNDAKWKDKVSIGSPLASGTSFTTVAFLAEKYGWDYFTGLRKNNIIAEGGNSGVVRRLQSKERPVGIVLMENILRLTKTDPRIKFVIPTDGAVIQTNVLALVKKEGESTNAQKVADWFFTEAGQTALTKSFMYSGNSSVKLESAPEFSELLKTAKPWTREFISKTMKEREQIKDQFSKIIF
jgi:iron(III) transport system substrate-binding protein